MINKYNKFNSIEELMDFTKDIIGKKFKDLDVEDRLANPRNKGRLGHIVETGFYGYPNNSRAVADFDEIGVELKVSGFLDKPRAGRVPKERISLSLINYYDIINEEFEFSNVLFKNEKILMIWYEYEKGKEYGEFEIKDFQLYDMSQDMETIKADWERIRNKIRDGGAHLLSEGDSEILGACTKSSNSSIRRDQPNSIEPAKPRAYSLRHAYLKKIFKQHQLEKIEHQQFK